MHLLQNLIAERVASGFKRKSIVSCAKWAESYRIMGNPFPGPWTFNYHPWLKEMHECDCDNIVGQKSAQMGYTEFALNLAFYSMDIKGIDVLYVLPAKTPDAADFSASRFNPAIESSTHLTRFFSDVQNIGHKRAGNSNLFIRGSKSRSALKSIPVGLIILDELDEMPKANVTLALERTAGQRQRQNLKLSTPTFNDFGINFFYNLSTQEHFFFTCPKCKRFTELLFPECLKVTADTLSDPKLKYSYIRCKDCKRKLWDSESYSHKWKDLKTGRFVAAYPGRESRGFYVNQMLSSAIAGNPAELAGKYIKGLSNPSDEQEFYNSALGLPHIPEGASITDEHLVECRKIGTVFKNGVNINRDGIRTMGVDIGKVLHVQIDEWKLPNRRYTTDLNIEAVPKCLYFTKVHDFKELDVLMAEWKIIHCVVDKHPEHRTAYEFACRFPGHVHLCFYARGVSGKQIHEMKDKVTDVLDAYTIHVDRTAWLDLRLGRYKRKAIHLPLDLSEEYKEQLKAMVRILSPDPDGNPVARYDKSENSMDHYGHASTYSEIAFPFAVSLGESHSIQI